MSKGRRTPLTFLVGIAAFAAILVPVLGRRYWWVVLAALLCWGAFTLIYWSAMTADPTSHPDWQAAGLAGAKDALVYLVFATVLYGIKRLVMSSTPQKPPSSRRH